VDKSEGSIRTHVVFILRTKMRGRKEPSMIVIDSLSDFKPFLSGRGAENALSFSPSSTVSDGVEGKLSWA